MRARGISVLGCIALSVALNSCGSGRKVSEWEEYTHKRNLSLEAASDLQGLQVPVLKAPGLERVWGSPTIYKDKEGGYVLTYTDPNTEHRRLMIHGETEDIPSLSSPPPITSPDASSKEEDQKWRKVIIEEEKVRWFQEAVAGSDNGNYYSTEGFKLKDASGKKGHYRIVAEAGDDTAEVARWFASVSFE